MTSGIYEIVSPSGKRYIGSARNFDARRRQHWSALRKKKHHSRSLQRAWEKYGARLQFRPILVCLELDLFFYEQAILDGMKPEYNISPSALGTRGLKWTDESKAKLKGRKVDPILISEGMLRCTTPEQRRATSSYARSMWTDDSKKSQVAKLTGLKQSKETKLKKSAALMGHSVSEETRRKIASHAGWKHTEETKVRMRGRVRTPEHAAALGLAAKGNKNRLGLPGPGRKVVVCIETGQSFQCIALAVKWLRLTGKTKANDSGISLACNGHRKIAYGFRWKFSAIEVNT